MRCSTPDRDSARERFGIAPDARCLLVMGGSQGARSINECAIAALAEQDRVATSTSFTSPAGAISISAQSGSPALPIGERYTLLAYEPDLGDCLAACDLVLAALGARSSS